MVLTITKVESKKSENFPPNQLVIRHHGKIVQSRLDENERLWPRFVGDCHETAIWGDNVTLNGNR